MGAASVTRIEIFMKLGFSLVTFYGELVSWAFWFPALTTLELGLGLGFRVLQSLTFSLLLESPASPSSVPLCMPVCCNYLSWKSVANAYGVRAHRAVLVNGSNMNKEFVFEIDADEVVKQTQSPWEFSGYSATMNEEHSERNTTSIDHKINAVINKIAKKYVEDDDIQHTEELEEDDGSEVSDGEEAAQGDDDEDSDDGEAEHIEEVSEDGEESEHSDDEESGGEEAEQSDDEESDGEAEQSDGPQIPRRSSSKVIGP